MILVLKAKCIFSCSSHCDREWKRVGKDHLSLSFIYDGLSIIGKCMLAFFRTTVCHIKTSMDQPWGSSLKCIGGCLLWESLCSGSVVAVRGCSGHCPLQPWNWLDLAIIERRWAASRAFFGAVISESCFKWPITCALAPCVAASHCWRAAPVGQLAGDGEHGLGNFRMAWVSRTRKQFACMKYFL